jgi:hypothetical protein
MIDAPTSNTPLSLSVGHSSKWPVQPGLPDISGRRLLFNKPPAFFLSRSACPDRTAVKFRLGK